MQNFMDFKNFYSHETDVYNLENFEPQIVDADYLKKLGVKATPSEATLQGLIKGSKVFMERIKNKTVIPVSKLTMANIDPDKVETEIHNYTGRCPTLTFEINPIRGCNVGCQYCLVTDGVHEQHLTAYENYHLYVRKLLEEMNGTPTSVITEEDIRKKNVLLQDLATAIEEAPERKKEIEAKIVEISHGKNWNHYYYFSPKTEAFQEPTVQTGIAHRILREFIAHFKKYPDSNARLFIASKSGPKHLLYKHEGESILDLFEQLKGKMQFNTSISIMPTEFRNLLEPYAAPIDERLQSVKLCQERGIQANSALIQPIVMPYLTDEHIQEFFDKLHNAGIINYKPEFLTACMENLAMLGQWLGHFDKNLERELYEIYIKPDNADHRKQRGRTAPERDLCIKSIEKMMAYTQKLGMSTSICYWVRKQLHIPTTLIPIVNANGFQCLGYQSKLFAK